MLRGLTDTAELDREATELNSECEVVAELTRRAVEENARATLDQADYNARRDALLARYDAANARLEEIETARAERRAKHNNITHFLKVLKKQNALVSEFDEELWYITVDRVEVSRDKQVRVIFRDGAAVSVPFEK